MPAFQAADIGPLYDFGIATRDGSALTVKNKDGKNVQISQLGFMAVADKQNPIKEATELQEKDRLVQLGSSNLIDREFDQWPQVSQGDWSGGLGQRVFGKDGDTSRYYDGEGLIWPDGDWVPQKALRGPTQKLPQGGSASPSAPDSGTETVAPGGSQTVRAAALALVSLQATGVVAQIGNLGAFATGSNTAVAPAFGQATAAGHFLTCAVSGQRQSLGASTNLGETSAATSGFDFSGSGADNVIGTAATFTVPVGGIYVNSISIYMGGHTAAVNTIFVVWNSANGNVLANSSSFSAGKGRSLKTANIPQTFIAAGTVIRIGFWRQQNQDAEWGVAASGSFNTAANKPWPAGQPTVACTGPYVCGHLQAYLSYQQLTAADIVQSNPGPAPGWTKLLQENDPTSYQQVQIWGKPNCGAGETAPAFSATAGVNPMHARLGEFSNIALSAPADQSAVNNNSNQTSISATAASVDTAAGDLVIMAGRWILNGPATATFTKSFNNNMTPVDMGDSGAASVQTHSAFAYAIVPSGAATFGQFAYNGTAGGFIDGLGMGYAVTYLDNQGAPHWHAAFFQGDQYYDVDLGANTGSKQGPLHMHIGGGYLWILFSEHPNTEQLSVRMLGCAYGSNAFTQLRNDLLTPTTTGTAGFEGLIQSALVGGKMYVAVLQADIDVPPGTSTQNHNALYVLDYSAGTGSAPTGATSVAIQFPFLRGFKIVDLCWQGNSLVLSVGDGFNSYIYVLNAPFSTINTEAVIPGISNAFLCAVGSTLFVVAWTATAAGVNRMSLYTLDGSSLTNIPFNPIVPFLDSITSPVAFGNYALWGVGYPTPGVPGQSSVSIYAFDAINGRIFRAITFTDPGWVGNDVFGHDVIGVYGVTSRTQAAGATFQSQLGLAIFSGQLSNATESAREFYWGVIPITPTPSFSGLLQLGVDITTGIIDFTAATNKLFRALLGHFIDGLVSGQSSPFITLNAWFNQDPGQLNAVPDFTLTTGVPGATPPEDLTLFTNSVGRKVVAQIISDGGGFNGAAGWQNSPKLIDLIIQAATGWVIDAALDLSPTAKTNAANVQEYAYQHQSVAGQLSIDHVAAYNFLRLLWRQRGGQIVFSLPNGDSYNALIQQMEFSSPKPFAASYRSDQQSSLQQICSIKVREDI